MDYISMILNSIAYIFTSLFNIYVVHHAGINLSLGAFITGGLVIYAVFGVLLPWFGDTESDGKDEGDE